MQLSVTPAYSVELFGGLRVRNLLNSAEHADTRFRTKQAGAMLAYLALHAGRLQSREVLQELFWPEANLKSARARLSNALWSLRNQLGADALLTERLGIGVSKSVTTDVACFEDYLDRAARLRESKPAEAERLYLEAMALYRRDLLPGYYDLWVTTEQDRLTVRASEALLRLARFAVGRGDRLAAVGYANRAQQLDSVEFADEAAALLEHLESAPAERLPASGRVAPHEVTSVLPAALPASSETPEGSPHPHTGQATSAIPRIARVPLTRILGRDEELRELRRLAGDTSARLIVLQGPGGVGKSRLLREFVIIVERENAGESQREVSAEGRQPSPRLSCAFDLKTSAGLDSSAFDWQITHSNPIYVDLVGLVEPHELPFAIAHAVRLFGNGQGEVSSSIDALIDMLKAIKLPVLLLDNFEHLLPDAAEWLEALLQGTPELCCIVTSRQRLSISGERVLPVRPLPLPKPIDGTRSLDRQALLGLMSLPSVALFLERARQARPDFSLTAGNAANVVTLLAAIDGLPLAIELAAAWAQVATPAEMVRRLEGARRFDLLKKRGSNSAGWGGKKKEGRHASLQAIIAWSVSQLPVEQQQTLVLLSVFRGGWSAVAAEAVVGTEVVLDHLAILCDLSLVEARVVADPLSEDGAGVRFSMLESVREYAAEVLESGLFASRDASAESFPGLELEVARRRHAIYFAEYVRSAVPSLQSSQEPAWMNRFDLDDANIRLVLDWSRTVNEPEAARIALTMASPMSRYWYLRGRASEGRNHIETALSRKRRHLLPDVLPHIENRRALIARAANGAAILAAQHSDISDATRLYRIALYIDREPPAPDAVGEPFAPALPAWQMRRASMLQNYAYVARHRGKLSNAYAAYEQSLELNHQMCNQNGVANTLVSLARIDGFSGQSEIAYSRLMEALQIARTVENTHLEAICLINLAEIRYILLPSLESERNEIDLLFRQALRIMEPTKDINGCAGILFAIGALALERGDRERGLMLVATYFKSTANVEIKPPSFVRSIEKHLRATNCWPSELLHLDTWRKSGYPFALSLDEAIQQVQLENFFASAKSSSNSGGAAISLTPNVQLFYRH